MTGTDWGFLCVSAGDSCRSQSALAALLFLVSDGLICICIYSLIHPFIYSFILITINIYIVIESIATYTICIFNCSPFQPSKWTTSNDYDFFGHKEHSKHSWTPFKVNWTATTREHVHVSLQVVISIKFVHIRCKVNTFIAFLFANSFAKLKTTLKIMNQIQSS